MPQDALAVLMTIYLTIAGSPTEIYLPSVVVEENVQDFDQCHRKAQEYMDAHAMPGRTYTYKCWDRS